MQACEYQLNSNPLEDTLSLEPYKELGTAATILRWEKKEVKGKASLAENTKNYTPEKMDVYD